MHIRILLIVIVCLFQANLCIAGSKTYYLKNPKPDSIKSINTSSPNGVYIVERLGIKTWYGHLVVPEFNKYIPVSEIIEWNEIFDDQELKGWVFIDTQQQQVHISVVLMNSKNNTFKPFLGNGVFKLK